MPEFVTETIFEHATDGTSSDSIRTHELSETGRTAKELTGEVGGVRSEVQVLETNAKELHQHSIDVEWRIRTAQTAKRGVRAMLTDIANLGFSWRDVARLLHVSVPAIQKWRRGEGASGDSRQKMAGLLAACNLIAQDYMVDEIASWFEIPLSSAPVTPMDLYAANRADLVFEYAGGHTDPESILTEFDPNWRDRYRSDFEVFDAGDSNRSIRMKD